jgi:hypothetical protein
MDRYRMNFSPGYARFRHVSGAPPPDFAQSPSPVRWHLSVLDARRLLDHLERVEVRHEPESCTCAQCQLALTLIREDVTEQLDVEPARFFVIRHIC